MRTYQQPKCTMPGCGRGADLIEDGTGWCARHSFWSLHVLTELCTWCGDPFPPAILDDEGHCGPCARHVECLEDEALQDRAIFDR